MISEAVYFFDQYTPEILLILGGLLFITTTLFLWIWIINRRHYHNLKHQIPAGVVKNYLDSIIQNSQSLKSSLFRGGGVDVDLSSLPHVLSPSQLPGSSSSVEVGGSREEINQKLTEIASLSTQLNTSRTTQSALEGELGKTKKDLGTAQARIKELEAIGAKPSAGGDGALKTDLYRVTKERDDLQDKLKEYEIIEDDLANLKRLQQENAQLKKALEGMGGAVPATPIAPPPVAEVAPQVVEKSNDLENLLNHETDDSNKLDQAELDKLMNQANSEVTIEEPQAPVVEAKAEPAKPAAAAANPVPEKTPEDLLSEFEKMLG